MCPGVHFLHAPTPAGADSAGFGNAGGGEGGRQRLTQNLNFFRNTLKMRAHF
jgi:hypothetical protein